MQAILDCEKPIIAAVNGTAAGGGAMFVLAADLVIAADTPGSSRCSCAAASSPTAASRTCSPALVGMQKAKELVFFGDDLPAADARAHRHRQQGRARGRARAPRKEWAERLANGPTKAIGWSKKLLHDALGAVDRAAISSRRRRCSSSSISRTERLERGRRSFIERRPTEWKGW